jgi:hypothetical protein
VKVVFVERLKADQASDLISASDQPGPTMRFAQDLPTVFGESGTNIPCDEERASAFRSFGVCGAR